MLNHFISNILYDLEKCFLVFNFDNQSVFVFMIYFKIVLGNIIYILNRVVYFCENVSIVLFFIDFLKIKVWSESSLISLIRIYFVLRINFERLAI